MHDETVIAEFTGQAASFHTAQVVNAPEILQRLVEIAQPRSDQRWIDTACGPGVVACALAPHVAEVVGVDATPAMVDLAGEQAAAHGVSNASFLLGDATALGLALEHEELVGLELDFDDWLARGSGRANAAIIEQALAAPPPGATAFAVEPRGDGRVLRYPLWVGRWRRPLP